MTWTEALRKGRARWLMWIAICSGLACGFLIKGGTESELLWAVVIGAVNGTAVGFALGPAAEKDAMILSGVFAGTPFYFIGISIFVMDAIEARKLHRERFPDVIPVVLIFLVVGIVFSFAQALRVRSRARQPRVVIPLWHRLQGKKKIALITLALAALAVLAGQLILFPGREIKAAREAVLRQDLFVLRSQLNQYAGDLHRRPQSLAELVAAGYIKQVPTDPMTGRNDTWVMDWSHEPKTPGIVDIHSGSRKYRDW